MKCMPGFMSPVEGLVRKVEGEVRKSWVDFFKNREMIEIRNAFEAGKAHANETPIKDQASGMDYYREIFLEDQES
jgi:hypothetical protein